MQGSRSLTAATIAALCVLVALPLAFIVLQAIFPLLGRGSLEAPFSRFVDTLADPAVLELTGNSLLLATCVMLLTAAIGIPLGLLRALTRLPVAPLWDILLLIPFMMPPYIAALGWILFAQPRGYLEQLTGVSGGQHLFSFWGVVVVMTLHALPVVYFAVSRTIEAVGGRLSEVARVFGASPRQALLRVTLPLALPSILASLLLVFAMTIEEYGTPAALGTQSGFRVLVTGIEQKVADWPVDLAAAAILSLVLTSMAIGAYALQSYLASGRSYVTQAGKPQPLVKRALGPMALPVLACFAVVVLLAIGVPIFAITATALSRTLSGGLAADNLSLQNFAFILDNRGNALQALSNSMLLAVATALLTGLVGALASYLVLRTKVPGRRLLDVLTALPNAIPGIVVAVGLILAWSQPFWPISPYNTPAILLLAYCCILLPLPVRYAGAAFAQIGDNLEAAARVSGATITTTLRRILLPLILPSLIAAMLLVFSVAARELVASVIVAPVGMPTISTFIWRQFEQGSIGIGMAMSLVALLITCSIPVAVTLFMNRNSPRV